LASDIAGKPLKPYSILFDKPDPSILLLGAHCDDIEIGCGATVTQLAARHPGARFTWVALSADGGGEGERAAETRAAARRLLGEVAHLEVIVEAFRGSYFPHAGEALKDCIESFKRLGPDLVLTHARGDLHQDHRVVNELTWNTFRDHAIWEYEIPKFDGDMGAPNVFVPLSRADIERKCEVLMECFPSQRTRAWFTPETFLGLARLRGIECQSPGGYAEAFYGRKLSIAL
jgi:LmbE family N-acetylglucosaminyl deacetylase